MKKVIITLRVITTSAEEATYILSNKLYKSGIQNYDVIYSEVDCGGWAWARVVIELEAFQKADKRSLKKCMVEIVDIDNNGDANFSKSEVINY